MDPVPAAGTAINSVVGVVAVLLVGIFVRFFRDMVIKTIPDGFALIREELQSANTAASRRHKEHIGRMDRLQATLDRQEDERKRGNAPRARRRKPPPPGRARKPK